MLSYIRLGLYEREFSSVRTLATFCNTPAQQIMSGGASIAGKIAVQVDARRDARSFW